MTTTDKTQIIEEFLKNGPKTLKDIQAHFKTLGQTLQTHNIKTLVAHRVIQSINIVNYETGKTNNGRKYQLVKQN